MTVATEDSKAWALAFRAAEACGCWGCNLFGAMHKSRERLGLDASDRLRLMHLLHEHLAGQQVRIEWVVNGEPMEMDLPAFGRALKRNRRLRDSVDNKRTYERRR